MRDTLTIPLQITPRRLVAIALMRSDHHFSDRQLELADRIRPALAGMHRLGRRVVASRAVPARHPENLFDPDTGIQLTNRELTVLEFLAQGMIAAAVARRLGISPRTVSKHLESIYRKFGVNDKVSAVLRAQSLDLFGSGPSS